MKRWALFLLLLNLALFAYLRWGDAPTPGEPARLATQIKPDAVRLLKDEEVPASEPETPASEVPASAPEAPASTATPVVAAATTPLLACVTWHGLGDGESQILRQSLRGLGLKVALVKPEAPASTPGGRWWVYIPPPGDLAKANAKAEQLKALGVTDFFVIQDNGRWHSAISLGIFSSQDAAEKRLADLQAQGVRSAVARPRDESPKHWIMRVDKVSETALAKLKTVTGQLAGATLETVACGG